MILKGKKRKERIPFYRKEENNELIFKNWKGSLERVHFNIKETRNETASNFKCKKNINYSDIYIYMQD